MILFISILLLALAIGCYSISQSQQHGKLKWMSNYIFGFWGEKSHDRKYKVGTNKILPAPDNWYYRFFKIKYKERFPLSTTFLISFTDGYHAMQSLSFIFFALSFSLNSGINFFYIWCGILLVNALTYKLLSK